MLCRIINDQPGPRVFFDAKRRPVMIHPGQSVVADLEQQTYEDARAVALVKAGPQIEVLDEQREEERAPQRVQLPPAKPQRSRRRVVPG